MSAEATETATAEATQPPDVAAMLCQIEKILRAIANRTRPVDGESVLWTVKYGYSGSVAVTAWLSDSQGKPIDRATVSESLRGKDGVRYPSHAEIIHALHGAAMRRAREYTKAFDAAVGE